MLKKKSSKILQINDIIDWYEKGELELSPKYQRNNVWNEKANSYLIDSIIKELPIPPIFMRQSIDLPTRKTFREIIDGQQRLRAITRFVNNEFKISRTHNSEYGGMKYDELPDEIRKGFLEYEIFAEIISDKEDYIVYDMFARLNTNNYILNNQELRNSKFWGEFKVAVYSLTAELREFFQENNIFNDKRFSRMDDAEFVSSLINLSINGIDTETPKTLDKLYDTYDSVFNEFPNIKEKLTNTFSIITKIYDRLNGNVHCFTSKSYFYTLYATIYHQMYKLDNCDFPRDNQFSANILMNEPNNLIIRIVSFEGDYARYKNDAKSFENFVKFEEFDKYHRTRTTNKNEREHRINMLNNYIMELE